MKLYLDQQPELYNLIKAFIDDLDPTYPEAHERDITEIDCRSRDGFIAHSHNCGGFDKEFLTDLRTIQGTGYSIAPGFDTDRADTIYNESLSEAMKEFKVQLKDIPKNKRDYHSLCESGNSALAETIDEYCNEWMSGFFIWFGYRAMYEGKSDHGWHTLMIYVSANESEYQSICGKGSTTLAEHEIKFRNTSELQRHLDRLKPQLETTI